MASDEPLIEFVRKSGDTSPAKLEGDPMIFIPIIVAIFVLGISVVVKMVLDCYRDRKKYEKPYDDQGLPNRPGGWGIQ